MIRRFAVVGIAALVLAAGLVSDCQAAEGRRVTITVANMHCANCAKKIARKLYAVPGVVSVRTDVKADTAVVTPQADKDPSPRALWEAVEKAGFKVVQIDSPAGKFIAKPGA
jgi:copper chaperone CopZ